MQYDVFISYSRKDYVDENGDVKKGSIVEKIKNLLKDNGISYWFDEDGINSGDEFAHLIANSIKSSKIIIFVSSENSNKSEWTRKEIATAISYKKKIIPFKYDNAPYDDSINFYISDFDYIAYNNEEKSFKRLVSSVKQYLDNEALMANKQKIDDLEKEKAVLKDQCNVIVDKINKIEKDICKLDKNRKEVVLEYISYEKRADKYEELPKQRKNGWLKVALLTVFVYALVVTIVQIGIKTDDAQAATEHPEVDGGQPVVTTPIVNEEEKPAVVKKKVTDTIVPVNGVDIAMVAVIGGVGGDFCIGKYEVTQELWKAVMGKTVKQQRDLRGPSLKLRGEGGLYPIYYVSWDDCQEFIMKLNALTGKKFRLPTEAEWKYAAMGGVKAKKMSLGDDKRVRDYAWYEDNSGGSTHLVGMMRPNELGLYDMLGNVGEWCQDKMGKESPGDYVVRGGNWASTAENCSVTERSFMDASMGTDAIGLRLVMD